MPCISPLCRCCHPSTLCESVDHYVVRSRCRYWSSGYRRVLFSDSSSSDGTDFCHLHSKQNGRSLCVDLVATTHSSSSVRVSSSSRATQSTVRVLVRRCSRAPRAHHRPTVSACVCVMWVRVRRKRDFGGSAGPPGTWYSNTTHRKPPRLTENIVYVWVCVCAALVHIQAWSEPPDGLCRLECMCVCICVRERESLAVSAIASDFILLDIHISGPNHGVYFGRIHSSQVVSIGGLLVVLGQRSVTYPLATPSEERRQQHTQTRR